MTCRKARALLSQRGIEAGERDFFKERLTVAELQALIDDQAPSVFFSFASPTFKASGLERAKLSGQELIELMAQEPRYIRRPIVVLGGKAIPGSSPKVLEQALAG